MRSWQRVTAAVGLALVGTSFAAGGPVALAIDGLPQYRVDVVIADAVGTAVNEAGDMVGWQTVSGGPRAFVHRSGALALLPNPSDRPLSVARDINDSGVVVGYAYKTTIDEPGNAMRWTLGSDGWTVHGLGFLPGDLVSEAKGVNDAGQIVGRSNPRSFLSEHGFLYTDATQMTELLAGYTLVPEDINELGVAVGTGYSTAWRVDATTGASLNLGTLAPYGYSHAYALNDAGQIAGALTSASGNSQVVARYSDASGWQSLGGLGGGSCSGCVQNIGWGINSAGTVVGTGWPRTGVDAPYQRAVIFLDSVGSLLYVDDVLETGTDWSIAAAYDINDAGQIVGRARHKVTGQWAAVRLTPIGAIPPGPVADTTPPAVAVPSGSFVAPQTLGVEALLSVSWPAAADPSGISGYELQERIGTGAWNRVTLPSPTATSVDVGVVAGSSYTFRVRATDGAGNIGAWAVNSTAKFSVVQENATSITYSAKFRRVALLGASGGYVRKTPVAGRTAALAVTGSSVAFVTTLGPARGIVQVRLDGGSWSNIDLYSAVIQTRRAVWATSLGAGPHTVEVRVTGTKNPASTSERVDVDAFLVLS